jgi:hypothetical protein
MLLKQRMLADLKSSGPLFVGLYNIVKNEQTSARLLGIWRYFFEDFETTFDRMKKFAVDNIPLTIVTLNGLHGQLSARDFE